MGRRKTTEEFIAEAKAVHGDRYDYSQTVYTNATTKLTIICREHGPWQTRPTWHLQGCGCQTCAIADRANEKRFSTDKFIERAKSVHGDLYDYSVTVYTTMNQKVKIICKKHGVFEQQAGSHLQGKICGKCYDEIRNKNKCIGTENFIQRARAKYGDIYNYDYVRYVDTKTPVTIGCPKHGFFQQTPHCHMHGLTGCTECGNELADEHRFLSLEEYISDFESRHGVGRFDFSQTVYKGMAHNIMVKCRQCGKILTRNAGQFLIRGKCVYCLGLIKDTETYIKQACQVHNNYYDYSLVEYKSVESKIKIICPKHGVFEQKAGSHLNNKCGCPKCSRSQFEVEVEQWLVEMGVPFEREKRFDWLKYKGKMRLDFFIPQLNVAIECQGVQHFGLSFEGFNDVSDSFETIRLRDERKFQQCRDHNIRIIYYSDYQPEEYFAPVLHTKDEVMQSLING